MEAARWADPECLAAGPQLQPRCGEPVGIPRGERGILGG